MCKCKLKLAKEMECTFPFAVEIFSITLVNSKAHRLDKNHYIFQVSPYLPST